MNTKEVMFTIEELYVLCMILEGFIKDKQLLKMVEVNMDNEVGMEAMTKLLVLNRLYKNFDTVLTDHNYDDLDERQFKLHKHDILTVDIVEDIEDKVLLGLLESLIINEALEDVGLEVCGNIISSLDVQDYD
jgi:hypothetical protein